MAASVKMIVFISSLFKLFSSLPANVSRSAGNKGLNLGDVFNVVSHVV